MLFDRFDNMRAKIGGSTDGFDLYKIGTKVKVQALSNINKGNKITGTLRNQNVVDYTAKKLNLNFTTASNDFTVGVDSHTIQSSETSILIYLFKNGEYTSIAFPFRTEVTGGLWKIQNWKVNPNGTLVSVCYQLVSDSSFVGMDILEIDKENKTYTQYFVSSSFFVNTPGTWYAQAIWFKDYLVTSRTTNDSVVKWNFNSHAFNFVSGITGGNITPSANTLYSSLWIDENTLLTSYNYGKINKTVFNGLSAVSTTVNVPDGTTANQRVFLFNNGSRVVVKDLATSKFKLYSFVPNELELTFLAEFNTSALNINSINYYELCIDGNYMLVYPVDSSGSLTTLVLYDITNLSSIAIVSSTQTEGLLYPKFLRFNNFDASLKKFYASLNSTSQSSANSYLVGFLIDNTAQYNVETVTSDIITSNKIYGIASESISANSTGFAQLLWSTYS